MEREFKLTKNQAVKAVNKRLDEMRTGVRPIDLTPGAFDDIFKLKAEAQDVVLWLKSVKDNNTAKVYDIERKFALNSQAGDVAGGGFLVPEILQTEILQTMQNVGIARRNMRYLPFGIGAGNEIGRAHV